MIKYSVKTKPKQLKIRINLNSDSGLPFLLLGIADGLNKEIAYYERNVTRKEIQDRGRCILKEMKASNYFNLIKVFEKYYSDYVILETQFNENNFLKEDI